MADTEVHSAQLSPIPFMQTGARNGDAALAQPDAPAIRFMPAVPDTDAQAQASSSDNEQASPDALDQATIPHTADLEASGVANNGKHPVVSIADTESSELQASPDPSEVPRPEGQQSPPQAAVSDSEGNAQHLALNDMTADLAVSQQQLVEGSADTSNPDATSQENALDKADTALNATSTSGSSPQQGAATDLPYQADTAVTAPALQSPFSGIAEPALQLAEFNEHVKPEDTEAVSPLQSSSDVSKAGSQLTQREGSQAQAAAVAEAIRKAAQLSASPSAQGDTTCWLQCLQLAASCFDFHGQQPVQHHQCYCSQ